MSVALPLRNVDIGLDSFIAIMSSRKTGKSYLIGNLIQILLSKGIDFMYLFSNTAKVNPKTNEQYRFIDPSAIFDASPETIETVMSGLLFSQKKTDMKHKILVILDDLILSRHYEKVEQMASMGRHYSITVILSTQITNHVVSPTVRANISYLFFKKISPEAIRDNVFSIVSPKIPDFATWRELKDFTYRHNTDHNFIFFDNDTSKKEGMDLLKIVRAEPIDENYKYIVKNLTADRQEEKDRRAKRINRLAGHAVALDSYMDDWSLLKQNPSFGTW